MPTLKLILVFLFYSSVTFISACSSPYSFTLNDNVIYSPNSASAETLLRDVNLQGCLNSVYISTGNSDPASITLLACPNSGISTLNGIEALLNLEQLDLSFNSVTDLTPLSNLKNLRLLSIGNNNIRNISSLFSLPILRFISLQGNNNISCRQLDNLADKLGATLTRPLSCL